MLTTSPIVSSSANASPSTFHYAPAARSPHSSPSRLSAAAGLPRRQSTSGGGPSTAGTRPSPPTAPLTSSPSGLPRTRPYVGVDASTQYSPMEQDLRSGPDVAVLAASVPATTTPFMQQQPPPPPHPQPLADDASSRASSIVEPRQRLSQRPAAMASASSSTAGTSSSTQQGTQQGPQASLSPSKRRNSQVGSPVVAELGLRTREEAESSSSAAKRARQSEAPPKILPLRYEFCEAEDMVVLIAHMLAELIETNDSLALRSGSLTRFHSRTAPGISVVDYLHRLAKHATLTPPLLLSMVYYIDRLCSMYPEFTINTLTVHRFLITAATVASKGLSDSFWNNTTYARVGGIRVAELRLLELEFLRRVDWKIVPNPEVLVAYYKGLVERCPGYQLEELEQPGEPSLTMDDDDDDDDEVDESDEADDEEDQLYSAS